MPARSPARGRQLADPPPGMRKKKKKKGVSADRPTCCCSNVMSGGTEPLCFVLSEKTRTYTHTAAQLHTHRCVHNYTWRRSYTKTNMSAQKKKKKKKKKEKNADKSGATPGHLCINSLRSHADTHKHTQTLEIGVVYADKSHTRHTWNNTHTMRILPWLFAWKKFWVKKTFQVILELSFNLTFLV